MSTRPTDPQLARLQTELDDLDRRATELTASVSLDAWQTRPAPDAWSASECFQHIVTSNRAMLDGIDAEIARGVAENIRGTGPFRAGLIGRLLLWTLEPPYRARMKTGEAFRPHDVRTPEDDLRALRESHEEVRRSLTQANGLALDRLSMLSPFARGVRYNLYTALALIPVHGRRHVWQAEQTLARLRA